MSRATEWIMSYMDLDSEVNVMMRICLSLITDLGFIFLFIRVYQMEVMLHISKSSLKMFIFMFIRVLGLIRHLILISWKKILNAE